MFWLGLILDLFLGFVWEHCWGHFCNYCATNLIKKRDLFWGLLEAVWSRLGGVLGCLGSLLGSLVFTVLLEYTPKCCFLNWWLCRYHSVLGQFSGPAWLISAHFGTLDGPRNTCSRCGCQDSVQQLLSFIFCHLAVASR